MKNLTMKILSQEAQIKTSPQSLSYNMLPILSRLSSGNLPSHPEISPAILFSIHSILVFIQCFHLSLKSTKNKTKNPLCYQNNKTITYISCCLYLLCLSFKQNKTKSPFVSQSLPTTLRLHPCKETLHPLVKPIKLLNPDTFQIQHPSVSFFFILIFLCFSCFCTLTD